MQKVVLGLIALAIALAYAPMLTVFFQQQWARPHSQYFPFVILAFIWLFWMRWRSAEVVDVTSEWPNSAKVAGLAAWLALLLAIAVYNPWLSASSLVLLAAAAAIVVHRRRNVRYLWGIWALLLLLLPLPLGLDQQLISMLQLVSSKWSSMLLDAFGVTHLMEGNKLVLPQKELFVDEACSGIVSMMSIVACAVIYGVWQNRPPLHVVLLAILGIGWAVVLNVFRITIIASVLDWYAVDWSSGAAHEILGLCLFVVAFGALVSTDLMLVGMVTPIEERWNRAVGKSLTYGKLIVRLWDRLVEWGAPLRVSAARVDANRGVQSPLASRAFVAMPVMLALGFGVVAVGQIVMLALASARTFEPNGGVARAKSLQRDAMPSSLAALQCTGFRMDKRERDDIFGEFSKVYDFRDNSGRAYTVSCDFPFSQGWHELTVCYKGVGWEVRDRQSRELSQAGSDDWTSVEAVMAKPDGEHGFVTWAIFDESGEAVSPPLGRMRDQIWRLLVRRSPFVPAPTLFQVQVFTQTVGDISEEQKQHARTLLADARERMRRLIAAEHKAPKE